MVWTLIDGPHKARDILLVVIHCSLPRYVIQKKKLCSTLIPSFVKQSINWPSINLEDLGWRFQKCSKNPTKNACQCRLYQVFCPRLWQHITNGQHMWDRHLFITPILSAQSVASCWASSRSSWPCHFNEWSCLKLVKCTKAILHRNMVAGRQYCEYHWYNRSVHLRQNSKSVDSHNCAYLPISLNFQSSWISHRSTQSYAWWAFMMKYDQVAVNEGTTKCWFQPNEYRRSTLSLALGKAWEPC